MAWFIIFVLIIGLFFAISSIANTKSELEKKKIELKNELLKESSASRAVEELKTEIKAINIQLEKVKDEKSEIQDLLEKSERQLKESSLTNLSLRTQIDNPNNSNDSQIYRELIKKLSQENILLKGEVEKFKKTTESSKSSQSEEVIKLERQLFTAKSEAEELSRLYEPFREISDVLNLQKETLSEIKRLESRRTELQEEKDRLSEQLNFLDLENYARDFGLYEPKYDFGTSARYKAEIDKLRAEQKAAIKSGLAYYAPQNWTVNGSSAAGRKMVKEVIQLQLRAFNGESEGLIAKVRFDNIQAIEERILKLFQRVNNLHAETDTQISTAYLELKIKELHLVHEYQEKKYLEAEEQRAIREQIREEEKAQRELERAIAEIQREEQRYQTALEKARREIQTANETRQLQLQKEIEFLTNALAEAEARNQRALSMAQQTRVGHVYVISNIGSFGENVYKIGMTRRLEPMDRVKELSNASVPFNYDVHAIIYSEDAPKLEAELHRKFSDRRVNQVNQRKEFFRVTLEEIRDFVLQHHGDIEFTMAAEAADFRKSYQSLSA